jgi:hypothetical protein
MVSLARLFACLILVASTSLAAASVARADRRVALVIGNGAYRHATVLANPRNDAEDVAAALGRLGFAVETALDADREQMQEAAIRFARLVRGSDVALFYYSGHALQFAGVNYLVPVDAALTDEVDLRRLVRADDIVADLQQAGTIRVLVLDACRDNPLAEELKRSVGRTRALAVSRGLAKIDSPLGTIISYATQAGRTADDGGGRNSPYTAAFLQNIEAREEIGAVFRNIAADVYRATGQTQLPELAISLIGNYHLNEPAAAPAQAEAPASIPSPAPGPVDVAAQTWAVTRDSTSIAVLEDFARQFGATPFGSMARARIAELRRDQVAALPPSPVATTPPVAVVPPPAAAKPPPVAALPPKPAAPAGRPPLGAPRVGMTFTGGGKIIRYYQSPSAAACRGDCEREPSCNAYGWIKPGGYAPGDPSMCYLDAEVVYAVKHSCCVVATRGRFPPPPP